MSIGDVLMGAMGGGTPAQQINQALAGPQPGAGGSQAAPGGQLPNAGGAQPLAPAQATQPPADLASLYARLMQQDRSANEFDRSLAMFAGGFKGPPGGADRLMRSVGPAQDPGTLLQNLMQMRQTQAYQAAIPGMLQKYGLDPSLAPLAMADPTFLPKIIENQAGISGPPVMQEMNRGKLIYMKQHGITDPNDPSIPDKYIYPDKYVAAGTAEGKQAGDVQEFKDNATHDFGTVDEKLDKGLKTVDQLLGNVKGQGSFDDTVTALTTIKPTTGKIAANMPSLGGLNPLAVSQEVKNQAVAINTLKGELSAEAMSGMKNIRNQKEFAAIVSSLTNALDPANSPEKIKAALQMIRGQILRTRAIATAAAGHQLSGELVGQLGPDEKTFLDPSSPYYNGATQEKAPAPKDDNTKIKNYNPKTGEFE